jgi:predicted DNA-binding transcriptional regulator AlpA
MDWSVLVETQAPSGAEVDDDVVISLLGPFSEKLGEHSPAVAGDGGGWTVRFHIVTGDDIDAAASAVERGSVVALDAASAVGLPIWPVIRTEAVEENTFHAQLEVSNFPSILGTTEVTELLGVSRQRLHELRNTGRFPAPAYEVAATPLWIRSTVDSFLVGWERKPGRPSKAQ